MNTPKFLKKEWQQELASINKQIDRCHAVVADADGRVLTERQTLHIARLFSILMELNHIRTIAIQEIKRLSALEGEDILSTVNFEHHE